MGQVLDNCLASMETNMSSESAGLRASIAARDNHDLLFEHIYIKGIGIVAKRAIGGLCLVIVDDIVAKFGNGAICFCYILSSI